MANNETFDFSEYANTKPNNKKAAPKKENIEEFDFAEYAEEPKKGLNTEAILGGVSDVATLGYLPQVTAIAEPLVSRGLNIVRKEQIPEAPWSQMKPGSPEFIKARDEYSKQIQDIKQKEPVSFSVGQIGGALATTPLIPIKGTGVLSGVGAGGLLGVVQNPGDIKGKSSDLQLYERGQNALTGGLLGGAVSGISKAIGKAGESLKNAPKKIDELAKNKAFKASGAMLKDFRKAFDKGKVNELGKEMFDSGLVAPGSTFDDVALKTTEIKKQVGNRIGEIYKKASEQLENIPIDENKIVSDLIDSVSSSKIRPTIGKKAYDEKMLSIIDDITKNTDDLSNPQKLNELIGEIDSKIDYAKKTQDLPEIQQGYLALRNKLRNILNDRIEQVGNKLSNPELKKELLELNKKYSRISELNKISTDRVARESANRAFGLTDTLVASGFGGAGAAEGYRREGIPGAIVGLGTGVAAGLTNKGLRQYGNPILSQGLLKTGESLSKTPSVITKPATKISKTLAKNPERSAILAQLLSKKKQEKKNEK